MLSDSLIPTAIMLINQFGSTITLKTETNSYNTATGQIESSLVSSDPIKAGIESYTSQEVQGIVQAGDMKVMIGNAIVPTLNNKVVFNSNTYNIINIEPLYMENVAVIYTLQVRK